MLDANQIELQRWKSALLEERAGKQDLEKRQQQLKQALTESEEREHHAQAIAEQEKQVAKQLQQALEELQYGQENDHQRMIDEMQQKAEAAESELESYKLRIEQMETRMEEANQAVERCGSLEQEVREKNLLIGKLRHEAVILNEHLTGALNRLRRDSADEQIDRCVPSFNLSRLMSNLILQFLGVPRADARRYEILRLLASILQWNDAEREKAGLQRHSERSSGYSFLGLRGLLSSQSSQPSKAEEKTGDEVRRRQTHASPLPIYLSSFYCLRSSGPRQTRAQARMGAALRHHRPRNHKRRPLHLISIAWRSSTARRASTLTSHRGA